MTSREVHRHNRTVIRQLEPGDMVSFPRGWYSHYAVYAGNGKVIHLSGDNDGIGDGWQGSASMFTICGREFSKAFVKEEDFFVVAMNSKAQKSNKDNKCNPIGHGWEIVRRAREKLGEIGYNVLWKNCEHFAAWCRYGKGWSEQARHPVWIGDTEKADTFLTFASIGLAVGGLVTLAMGMRRTRRNSQED